MKTLVISDLHLTEKFNNNQFSKLLKLITSVDKVIINGDFWDGEHVSFDAFVNSEWNRLFPMLKDKKTIYIYGNHDEADRNDDRVSLFSDKQVYSYELDVDNKTLYITHGQKVSRYINKLHIFLDQIKPLGALASFTIKVLVKILGLNYYNIYRKMNEDMKFWARKNLTKKQILVCGHSHLREFNLKEGFINLGFNHYGYMQYLLIDNNKLIPKYERY